MILLLLFQFYIEIMKNNPIIKKWFRIQFEGFLCLIRLGFFFYFIFVIFFGGRGSGFGGGGGSVRFPRYRFKL